MLELLLTQIKALRMKHILLLPISSILGFLAFYVPIVIIRGSGEFTRFKEGYSIISQTFGLMVFPATIIILFFIGCILGILAKETWLIVGLFTILIFPIALMHEMNVAPNSHQLGLIEFVLQIALSLPAIGGAYLGAKGIKEVKALILRGFFNR